MMKYETIFQHYNGKIWKKGQRKTDERKKIAASHKKISYHKRNTDRKPKVKDWSTENKIKYQI